MPRSNKANNPIQESDSGQEQPLEGAQEEAVLDADEDQIELLDEEAELDDVLLEAEEGEGELSSDLAVHTLKIHEPGPLAKYDPLQAYMRDVQRYPLLTPEEEREHSIRYYESGDVKSAARLVTANLRLVVKIAYNYRHAYKNIMDVVQEGNIGLMQAIKKYDPYRGVKLSTYAAWWIRAYILRFILNNARLVKLGTTQAQRKLFFNLKKEKAKLSAMGIEPTTELIADRLNVPQKEVVQMDRRLASGDMSLDAPIKRSEEDSQARLDLLPVMARGAEDILADEEFDNIISDKLLEFGKGLKGKEHRIFHERLMSDEPKTLQELGDIYGISRERIRQLEKRLQEKLKVYLLKEVGEDVLTP